MLKDMWFSPADDTTLLQNPICIVVLPLVLAINPTGHLFSFPNTFSSMELSWLYDPSDSGYFSLQTGRGCRDVFALALTLSWKNLMSSNTWIRTVFLSAEYAASRALRGLDGAVLHC